MLCNSRILALLLLTQCTTSASKPVNNSTAFKCELFNKSENQPGGDVPALTLYTNTDAMEAADTSCKALVGSNTIVGYRLAVTTEGELPADWRSSELTIRTLKPSAKPDIKSDPFAYKCELFNKPEGESGSNIPAITLYSDSSNLEEVKTACTAKVDGKRFLDGFVTRIKLNQLPSNWKAKRL